jgi:hypothetical protein
VIVIFTILIVNAFAAEKNPQTVPIKASVQILKNSQKPPFDMILISNIKISKVVRPFLPQTTQFDVTIKNNSQKPIEKFTIYIAAKAKGRTIPLAEDKVEFEAKTGIEPKETKTISMETNPFIHEKWSEITIEEINAAEIIAELIAITFYRERQIKSDSKNVKYAEELGLFPTIELFEEEKFPVDKPKYKEDGFEPYKFPQRKR